MTLNKKKEKIGILYDNISGNTGDVAIGLSVKKILRDLGIDFEELTPGQFNPQNYDHIIIGGGHLLRNSPDFFYDKFKIPGHHILNASGILGNPSDLNYLNDYSYISVRSQADKTKLSYLQKEVEVVPDTSMLLEDLKDFDLKIKGPSIGIHIVPSFLSPENEADFSKWISSLGFNVFLLPITHYNQDYVYLRKLSLKIKNSTVLPLLKAQEIFTIIGKFDYFFSCSLHGAIFSYVHNTPFIVPNYEKIKFFMDDRDLEKYAFSNYDEMKSILQEIISNRIDYSQKISNDKKKLEEHVKRIGEILSYSANKSIKKSENEIGDILQQSFFQINFLQSQKIRLDSEIKQLHEELRKNILDKNSELSSLQEELAQKEAIIQKSNSELSSLQEELAQKELHLKKIKNSFTFRTLQKYDSIFKKSSK